MLAMQYFYRWFDPFFCELSYSLYFDVNDLCEGKSPYFNDQGSQISLKFASFVHLLKWNLKMWVLNAFWSFSIFEYFYLFMKHFKYVIKVLSDGYEDKSHRTLPFVSSSTSINFTFWIAISHNGFLGFFANCAWTIFNLFTVSWI